MRTAKKCGIDIPEIRLINDRYFSIKRFDVKGGHRIHTLTAAALLQSDFSTQSIDYVNLLALTGYLTQDPAQVEQMFRRMVFNIVCVNKDDHAKTSVSSVKTANGHLPLHTTLLIPRMVPEANMQRLSNILAIQTLKTSFLPAQASA